MKFEIDQAIIDRTECEKGYMCLSGNDEDIFDMKDHLGHNMLVLEHDRPKNCPHNHNYGSLHVCKCPVRVEIYNKYGR